MSAAEGFVKELEMTLKYFKATASVFSEEDSSYAPQPKLYTVAGHVAHAADSVDWFVEGAFGNGWDMEFEALIARAKTVTSLKEATDWLERACGNISKVVGAASDAELFKPIADTRIMEGAPRSAIVSAVTDHTAHHRGALAVYARLLGKEPPMPYA